MSALAFEIVGSLPEDSPGKLCTFGRVEINCIAAKPFTSILILISPDDDVFDDKLPSAEVGKPRSRTDSEASSHTITEAKSDSRTATPTWSRTPSRSRSRSSSRTRSRSRSRTPTSRTVSRASR